MSKNSKVLKEVVSEFTSMKERRKPLDEGKWLDYYKKLYMYKELTARELNDIELGVKSDIRLPRYIANNEVKRPRLLTTLFSYNPIVKAVVESTEAIDSYKMFEILVNKYIREGLYIPLDLAINQQLYLGTGCYMMEYATKTRDDLTVDKVRFRFCDMFNTYVPDTAVCREDIDVVYRRFLKRRSYLKKQEDKGIYKNIDKVPELGPESDTILNNAYIERMGILGLSYGSEELGASYGAEKKEKDGSEIRDDIIEVIERWTPETKVTIANREVVISEETEHIYGFLPFYFLRNYRNDGMFYGMGEVELLAGIPSYMDEMKNMRMDIIRRVAYPAALISRNARIPKEDLIPKPMQIIRTFDMEGYKEVQRPDVKRILMDEEFVGKQDQQDATGLWSYLAGGPAPRAETATTALTMKEAGMERINSILFFMCKDALEPMCFDMAQLIKKNFKNGDFVDMSSYGELPSPIKVKAEDLDANISWEVSAFQVQTVSDVNIQQSHLALFRELKDSPRINHFELEKKLLQTFNIKNLDEMLVKGTKEIILSMMEKDEEFAKTMTIVAKNPRLTEAIKTWLANALQRVNADKAPIGPPSDNEGLPKSPGQQADGTGIPAGSAAPSNMSQSTVVGGGEHIGKV